VSVRILGVRLVGRVEHLPHDICLAAEVGRYAKTRDLDETCGRRPCEGEGEGNRARRDHRGASWAGSRDAARNPPRSDWLPLCTTHEAYPGSEYTRVRVLRASKNAHDDTRTDRDK
jgi:hypothetical protein